MLVRLEAAEAAPPRFLRRHLSVADFLVADRSDISFCRKFHRKLPPPPQKPPSAAGVARSAESCFDAPRGSAGQADEPCFTMVFLSSFPTGQSQQSKAAARRGAARTPARDCASRDFFKPAARAAADFLLLIAAVLAAAALAGAADAQDVPAGVRAARALRFPFPRRARSLSHSDGCCCVCFGVCVLCCAVMRVSLLQQLSKQHEPPNQPALGLLQFCNYCAQVCPSGFVATGGGGGGASSQTATTTTTATVSRTTFQSQLKISQSQFTSASVQCAPSFDVFRACGRCRNRRTMACSHTVATWNDPPPAVRATRNGRRQSYRESVAQAAGVAAQQVTIVSVQQVTTTTTTVATRVDFVSTQVRTSAASVRPATPASRPRRCARSEHPPAPAARTLRSPTGGGHAGRREAV